MAEQHDEDASWDYWLLDDNDDGLRQRHRPAPGAYADVLDPPHSVCDVTYWLNSLLEEEEEGQPVGGVGSGGNYKNDDDDGAVKVGN